MKKLTNCRIWAGNQLPLLFCQRISSGKHENVARNETSNQKFLKHANSFFVISPKHQNNYDILYPDYYVFSVNAESHPMSICETCGLHVNYCLHIKHNFWQPFNRPTAHNFHYLRDFQDSWSCDYSNANGFFDGRFNTILIWKLLIHEFIKTFFSEN